MIDPATTDQNQKSSSNFISVFISTKGLPKRTMMYKEKPTATPKATFRARYMKKISGSICFQVIIIKEKMKG
jgi:hypothetical protein